ncbi:MAG: response regulator [Kouleothrix sp.]|nr:response regulator [Kouleothrix sp.]
MTRILIADDESAVRQLLELVLTGQGYEVALATNGEQLVRMAQERVPDLVLIDLMMPQLDGYEAIRQLRNDTRTAHLPMLILTAKSTLEDVVIGFETGADDYITKPFNIPELLARIKSHLRRANQQPVRNPLTGLPGNILLTEELKYRLSQPELFAYLYVDLDNFKAFNDTYGPARGDRVIKLLAQVLSEAVEQYGSGADFIGHFGGDDFAILTTPDLLDTVCEHIISLFDERVRLLYDPEDRARGYLHGADRQGAPRRFPIITISIGVATNRHRGFSDHDELSRIAAEMKQFAKQESGSSYAVDVRGKRELPIPEERRGSKLPTALLIIHDLELRKLLRTVLKNHGYRTLEAPGVLEADALLAYEPDLTLILADARLGDQLWEMADELAIEMPDVPLAALISNAQDEALGRAHGVRAFLQQPFDEQQVHSLIDQLV